MVTGRMAALGSDWGRRRDGRDHAARGTKATLSSVIRAVGRIDGGVPRGPSHKVCYGIGIRYKLRWVVALTNA